MFRRLVVGDYRADEQTRAKVMGRLLSVQVLDVEEKSRSVVCVSVRSLLGLSNHTLRRPSRDQAEEVGRSSVQTIVNNGNLRTVKPRTARAEALWKELLIEETHPTSQPTPLTVKVLVINALCQGIVSAELDVSIAAVAALTE
jgi:hypothetical protein